MIEIPIASETAPVNNDRKPFLPEEIKRMEAVLVDEKNGINDTFAFTLLRWTGLRKGDAVDLRWREINGVISRTTQKSRTKNKKTAVIPIRPELRAALDAERRRQGNPAPDAHVLLNRRNNDKPYVNKDVFGVHIRDLGKRAGVDAFAHRFRHTFVEFLYLGGLPVEDIAEMIADDAETIRKHYSKYSKQRQEEAHRESRFCGRTRSSRLDHCWSRTLIDKSAYALARI